QLSPGLAARHIVLAHSTVAPQTMHAAAQIIERRGARFVEAPFTGSKEAAENGELVYYVAGDEAALCEARPILEASGKQDMQIASRLGLSHHLELGVSSIARDRLLEQMQRGHGDEDYSAIVRKYFPDIRPAKSEQAGLELFEARVPATAPSGEAAIADSDQPNNGIQSFPRPSEETVQT